MTALITQEIQTFGHGDTVNPGIEVRRLSKPADRTIYFDKRFLGQVLGILAIIHDAKANIQNMMHAGFNQLSEGLRIPLAQVRPQLIVVYKVLIYQQR